MKSHYERIEIAVGPDDALRTYALTMEPCGRPIGSPDLLQGVLRGRGAEDILALTIDGVLEFRPVADAIEEFIVAKHLSAVQSGLRVLLGHVPAGPGAACSAARIQQNGDETTVVARLRGGGKFAGSAARCSDHYACGSCSTCHENGASLDSTSVAAG